ncbi:aromatic ring-hydroxylating dioxygenase subunit alpha [Reyranella soli]|uniref:Phenoxybenzoate dioxygenase n=1 Tax=Reyranella soli TaxID=1230389 RepID=A0A512N3A0_9HYPH|nr:aromatic ring-hydroxylating dioxygenase subunit alpha [Reyranella soli]GEP53480.1 phenoxybenzoate dioxygenase [Reyranella soli]
MSVTDFGSAYARKPPNYNAKLTEVGRGTPMGELLRRYWHPAGIAADAGATPRPVKVLGEELILFRDGQGRAGLVYPRCCHRGTTLYYGKIEERGIRCCYHGWLFDVEGHCLEMPCEPNPSGPQCQRVRQPWYPVEERYGLVFAYLGPPEKKPVLPRYECLEVMGPGEFVEADDSSIGSGGIVIAPCNWLQHFENVVDPYHVPVLHGTFSGPQFVEQMATFPKVKFEYGPRGVKATSIRPGPNGKRFRRITEAIVPTLRLVANPRVAQYGMVESIGWTLPIDDTHYRIYVAGRVKEKGELAKFKSRYNGKTWAELSPEEHQQFPGDTEAQVGQGAITFHSEEHLMSSDQGVSMLRLFLRKQVDTVAAGGDPVGVAFDEESAYVKFDAGQFLDEV